MSVADEIEKLNNLKEEGAISEDEYKEAKEALLGKTPSATDTNMWAMFIHLSQFCGFIIPLAGWIVPIVLWQVKKNESEIFDKHGRIVANWLISELIYAIVFVLLTIILIGFPLLIILTIIGIVFPIIGGVKANNGEIWRYPLSISFFQID